MTASLFIKSASRALSRQTIRGIPVMLHTCVAVVDAVFRSALAAGATDFRPLEHRFYGDRAESGSDRIDYQGVIAAYEEDVTGKRSSDAARRYSTKASHARQGAH